MSSTRSRKQVRYLPNRATRRHMARMERCYAKRRRIHVPRLQPKPERSWFVKLILLVLSLGAATASSNMLAHASLLMTTPAQTTVGYTTIGGSTTVGLVADYSTASQATLANSLTVNRICWYLSGGSSAQVCKAAIYGDAAGTPGSLIVSSGEVTIASGQAAGWVNFTITATNLAAGTYWIALQRGAVSAQITAYYDAGGTSRYVADTYSDGPANPFGAGSGSVASTYSAYADFVASTTQLKDVPLNTAWPGPEGGTLGSVSENALYGTGGTALKDTPITALWPPTFSSGGGGGGTTFASALTAWVADAAQSNFGSPWTGEGHLPNSTGAVTSVSTSAALTTAINGAVDGAIIELASGTYQNISISNKTHSPSNPVTIRPAAGAVVHITTPTGSGTHAWYMTNCQGFKLVNLTFDYARYCSIKLDTHVKDIEIIGCTFTQYAQFDSGHGILVDFECERIAIWNCKTYNGGDHGLYLGSQGQPVSTALFGVKGLIVGNHISYDNYKGTGASSGASAGFGIQLGDSVVHARVVNCTCDGNGIGGVSPGGFAFYTQGSVTGDKGTDVCFYNNMSTNNTGSGFYEGGTSPNAATNKVSYNLTNGNSGSAYYTTGASLFTIVAPNFTGNPLYANRTGKDFRPSISGPAHNVGDPTWTPATDFAGAARTTPDLGALASA